MLDGVPGREETARGWKVDPDNGDAGRRRPKNDEFNALSHSEAKLSPDLKLSGRKFPSETAGKTNGEGEEVGRGENRDVDVLESRRRRPDDMPAEDELSFKFGARGEVARGVVESERNWSSDSGVKS